MLKICILGVIYSSEMILHLVNIFFQLQHSIHGKLNTNGSKSRSIRAVFHEFIKQILPYLSFPRLQTKSFITFLAIPSPHDHRNVGNRSQYCLNKHRLLTDSNFLSLRINNQQRRSVTEVPRHFRKPHHIPNLEEPRSQGVKKSWNRGCNKLISGTDFRYVDIGMNQNFHLFLSISELLRICFQFGRLK